MDKLKTFIDTNREAFEDELLPEGHFDRFEQKLPKPRKSKAVIYSLYTFAVAACISLLFLVRIPEGELLPEPTPIAEEPCTCEFAEEFEELRLYYNMQISEIISQMKTLCKQQSIPGAEGLLQETNVVLADSHAFEETILPTLPCSNDGLYTMNMHYNASLKSLNGMLAQMEELKTRNKKQH